ncbi:HET-domain-containing protein [Hypoxylon sp. FL1857]|nr:HET-domain-containing protein [Hypoxylon sp. FL1857]
MIETDEICSFLDEETIALKHELVADFCSSVHSCSHCRIFEIPKLPLDKIGEHWPFFQITRTVDEIHQLAIARCPWWSLFDEVVINATNNGEHCHIPGWHTSKNPKTDVKEGSAFIQMSYALWKNPIEIGVYIATGYRTLYRAFLALTQPDERNSLSSNYLPSPINANPGSEKSMQLICSWLEACSVQHGCGIQNLPPSLPSILLAVGNKHTHLVDAADQLRERYVALSYCWGPEEQKTLLKKENKQQLFDDIPFENLDATVQDAVTVTRSLGFQYLWIDALCIVQDDKEAKAREITRMHEVYRNATVTLIPSRAAGVREGFLSKRESAGSTWPHCIFQFPYVDGDSTVPGRTVILAGNDFPAHQNDPWAERAWTLQEGLMSGRYVKFGAIQTTWSCHHAKVQYRDNDGWVPIHNTYRTTKPLLLNKASKIIKQFTSHGQIAHKDAWSTWDEILEDFSRRHITYQSDRLPAISSIAREFAKGLKDTYICGLWKSRLHHDLLWRRTSTSKAIKPQFNVRPSWSWAASQWPMRPPSRDVLRDDDFEVLDYYVQPELEGDMYGVIRSANLRVRGLIASVPTPILTDRRANLVGILDGDVTPDSYFYRNTLDGGFKGPHRKKLLAEIGRKGIGEKDRIDNLFATLACTHVLIDDYRLMPNPYTVEGEAYRKSRPKLNNLSLLVVGHEKYVDERFRGPSGLLITQQEDGTYHRVGYFRVGDARDGKFGPFMGKGYSHPSEEEYRSRQLHVWGKENDLDVSILVNLTLLLFIPSSAILRQSLVRS